MPITSQQSIDYAALFHALPSRFIVFAADDPDFTIIEESEDHARIAMVNREETIGKPVLEAFPDTSVKYKKTGKSDLVESLRKVIRTGEPDTMETLRYDLYDPDGKLTRKYWKITHYPYADETGKIAFVIQKTEDITERITTGLELERTKRRLAQALSAGLIGTWVWEIKKDIVIADSNMANIFSVPAEEAAAGLPLSMFVSAVHEDDRPKVQKAIDKALRKGGDYNIEYRTVGRDGSIHWVIARGKVEYDEAGEPKSFPGVLVDITERKIAETRLTFLAMASKELSTSLEHKKTLQNIAKLMVPDIADWCSIEILDSHGMLQQVAVAHRDPKKVKWAKELRKQQGPPPMDQPHGLPKVIRTGESEYYPHISDDLLVAVSRDEEQLKLMRSLGFTSAIIVPLSINDITVGGISLISAEQKRQFTKADLEMAEELAHRASLAMTNANLYEHSRKELAERERLQNELEEINETLEQRVKERTKQLNATNMELERSNRELEDFAYVASHDLREPLRKIQAFSNLLSSEYNEALGENGRDYVERMRSAAKRMSVLIEDLLAFSRVTTKTRTFTNVDLTVIVHEVLEDLETRIRETNGNIDVGLLPVIKADPLQMRQLFQNLLGNALKFHRPNVPPEITIESVQKPEKNGKIRYCTITVSDNGLGFDEKYLDRIFAVFQRLHGRDTYGGAGIGLAVCRKIVERHNGSITATSQPGKGSTFIIKLPIAATQEQK